MRNDLEIPPRYYWDFVGLDWINNNKDIEGNIIIMPKWPRLALVCQNWVLSCFVGIWVEYIPQPHLRSGNFPQWNVHRVMCGPVPVFRRESLLLFCFSVFPVFQMPSAEHLWKPHDEYGKATAGRDSCKVLLLGSCLLSPQHYQRDK